MIKIAKKKKLRYGYDRASFEVTIREIYKKMKKRSTYYSPYDSYDAQEDYGIPFHIIQKEIHKKYPRRVRFYSGKPKFKKKKK